MQTQFRRTWSILFLFLVTAVFVISNVQAQIPEPPVPARLDPERFEPIPYLETETTNIPSSRPESPNVTTWGKVVFQSYRNGNWEIYTMDDTGENQRRLTNQAQSDIHPRLNRGNTLIAFASNRDGDYEIYMMNADGSGLRQLTNNTTDDVNPTWSFDGTKLAFQAYRDGQAEIYTMDSNGTNQTRLTVNSAYEGTPSWSPDGQKIAFVSNRSGGYRIYVMNSQTGSSQTQLSNQPNSFNPIWSTDGTKIAYDADGDGDGWQDVWIMNSDGSNQVVKYNPPGQTDAWVRSWFWTSLIAFTEISFIQYQGNWYWTKAFASYIISNSSGVSRFSLIDSTDWNPDWQTSDAKAPYSIVTRAPQFVQREGADYAANDGVCYFVYDTGGSGENRIEMQYRQEGEVWSSYGYTYDLNQTCETYRPNSVNDNRFGWFEFRGRAFDNSYNSETWPLQPDFRFLVYEWRLETTTQDIRGNFLENIEISAGELLHKTVEPELSSQTYYFPDSTQPTIGWGGNGFLSLPLTTFDIFNYFSAEMDVYLPSGDNLINDWGFENNNLGVSWGVTGPNTAASAELLHSGLVSAPFDATNRAISQTVTLPNDMTNPTLSFLHRAKYVPENVRVTISEGTVQTPFTFNTSINWEQSWIDMSPWLGKTVTITFANETPEDLFYLDEVTLGSAHPNIWIDLKGDFAARRGEQLVYEIRFGNDTNLDAENNVVTLTLPSSVNYVSATTPPSVSGSTLTWSVGDLLADSALTSIFVTTTVKASAPLRSMLEAQVTIDSATPELVLENNTAVFSTFVGDFVYIPFIMRN